MEEFKEQALATVPEPPLIRKRYVDDTEQNKVDIFLNHLNQ